MLQLPLPEAERQRLENILERDRKLRAEDPQAIEAAEEQARRDLKLAREALREQRRERQERLIAFVDQVVEELTEAHGAWLTRDLPSAAASLKVSLRMPAEADEWPEERIEKTLRKAVRSNTRF